MPAALTKRALDAAEPRSAEYFLWCGNLAGFGARVYPTGRKVFIAQVRVGRATRRVKIGAFGLYTIDQARERARTIIQAAAEGRDPQREKHDARAALTVSELCSRYLEAARAGLVMSRFGRPKRQRTVSDDEGRIVRHIAPLIGAMPAPSLRRADVQRMCDAIASGKTAGTFEGVRPRGKAVVTGGASTAARVIELLGGIYTWAEKRDLVPGPNPVRGVEKVRLEAKDRTLSTIELQVLGRVLRRRANKTPAAVAAIRLIALTGLRYSEACGLRWREIDLAAQSIRLEQSKTGRSIRPIGKAALAVLRSVPRLDGLDWVFPSVNGNGPANLQKLVAGLFEAAGITDARSHDLRRTFASIAADMGYSDATIAELLGHARRGVTERHYVRRSDPVLIAAVDQVAAHIAAALDGEFDAMAAERRA